jgi:hypothetical protein
MNSVKESYVDLTIAQELEMQVAVHFDRPDLAFVFDDIVPVNESRVGLQRVGRCGGSRVSSPRAANRAQGAVATQ